LQKNVTKIRVRISFLGKQQKKKAQKGFCSPKKRCHAKKIEKGKNVSLLETRPDQPKPQTGRA
jgi:hypothetical protein